MTEPFHTHLTWDTKSHHLFSELQRDFLDMPKIYQKRFVRRHGFDLTSYRSFVESSFMVFVTYGRIIEDIGARSGKFFIEPSNIDKRNDFLGSIPIRIPKKWKLISQWELDDYDMYNKI
jgi:hypothetical protein